MRDVARDRNSPLDRETVLGLGHEFPERTAGKILHDMVVKPGRSVAPRVPHLDEIRVAIIERELRLVPEALLKAPFVGSV